MDVRFGLSKLTSKLGKDEIACDFLLACNFTDTRLLGLNSLRFSRLRIDRGWASPYSSSLKRPCDGTSGLVRGNRRKAVFAFKGLFSKDICQVFAIGQRNFYRVFRKCGKKSETSERNPIFGNKTAGRGSVKPGSGRQISVFSPRFRNRLSEVCGKFRNQRAYRPFRAKKPQLEAMLHAGVLGKF